MLAALRVARRGDFCDARRLLQDHHQMQHLSRGDGILAEAPEAAHRHKASLQQHLQMRAHVLVVDLQKVRERLDRARALREKLQNLQAHGLAARLAHAGDLLVQGALVLAGVFRQRVHKR